MAENPEPPPDPFVDPNTGQLTEFARRWLESFRVDHVTQIGGILSGANQLSTQLQGEATARIAGDQATAGSNDGSGTSNSTAFSNGLSSGTSWVVIATVSVTDGGAGGNYTITVTPDIFINGEVDDGGTFQGNWRIREELTGGGTEYTLDSGTFSVATTTDHDTGLTYFPVNFTGLPSGLIAANEGAQVDIRLEIQRASGTNEITAPGLSGSMMVEWTP